MVGVTRCRQPGYSHLTIDTQTAHPEQIVAPIASTEFGASESQAEIPSENPGSESAQTGS